MSDSDESYGAGRRFWEQTKEADTWKEWLSGFSEFATSFTSQVADSYAPITAALGAITVFIFLLQVSFYLLSTESTTGLLTVLTQEKSLRGMNAWIFINVPYLPWILSPFIHAGIKHFTANLTLLALFGKFVEPRFQTRDFILWFLAVTIIVKPVDAFISLSTNPESNAAVYGISDFVYSLSFFSAVTLWSSDSRNELESVALLIGVLSVLLVALELAGGALSGSVHGINWAHLLGGFLGIIVVWLTNTTTESS